LSKITRKVESEEHWMARAYVRRIPVIVGCAVGLLILPALWLAPANACMIFVRSPVAVSAAVGQCAENAPLEDAVWDRDQKVLTGDNLAASDPSDLALWSHFEGRPQVLAVNVNAGRPSPSTVSSVGTDVFDTAASPVPHDPGSGPLQTQHTLADLHLAFSGLHPKHPSDREDPLDDVLWQSVKYVAKYYDIMNPDSDFAAFIRVGVEAIHTIRLDLDAVATATGLAAANRYQSVSLAGDAADTGLLGSAARRTASGSSAPEVGSVAYYLAAMQKFVFSRDGLIGGLIIMVAYIAISGLYSMLRGFR
jgi:hypothetical protein